jgi:polysaccharide deacetylase family protein (PEP-CTERM system associated)
VGVRPPISSGRLAFTVDVEEWFTGVADEPSDLRRFTSRLDVGMRRLLALLDRTRTRATFFFLGYLAEERPQWVAEVAARGHEIGCHGFYHRALWQTSPAEFRADLTRARRALFAAGAPCVDGFRAPLFSVRQDTLWALPIVEELGFRYSSSVFPIVNPRYGYPRAPALPFYGTPSGRFLEFPMSTVAFGGTRFPFAGGFYLRALPASVLCAAFASLLARGEPGVSYIHPWELDPEQPPLPTGYLARTRHRLGLAGVATKLEIMLRRLPFASMGDVLGLTRAAPERRRLRLL